MLLDNAKANAEPQAGAFPNGFRRIEGIEHALRVLEAGAGIGEQDHDVPAVADRRDPVLRYRSEEHTSELQSQSNLVCRLLLEKKKTEISHTNSAISVEVPSRDM